MFHRIFDSPLLLLILARFFVLVLFPFSSQKRRQEARKISCLRRQPTHIEDDRKLEKLQCKCYNTYLIKLNIQTIKRMTNPTYEPIDENIVNNSEQPATKADVERILRAIEILYEQINDQNKN